MHDELAQAIRELTRFLRRSRREDEEIQDAFAEEIIHSGRITRRLERLAKSFAELDESESPFMPGPPQQ